jgi:flagellar protein FlaG
MNIPISNVAGRIADPAVHTTVSTASLQRTASAKPSTPVSASKETQKARPERALELETELAAANQKLADGGHEMRFEYDHEANRLIVRLVDSNTHEVLRQFPNDEALRAARQIKSGKPLINLRA